MRYLGGKCKLARQICSVMQPQGFVEIWEPFCGGGWVTAELSRQTGPETRILASDNHQPLIRLWRAVSCGWIPTSDHYPTRAEYSAGVERLRTGGVDLQDTLLGFACSYNSTFCGSYAPQTTQDYLAETCRSLIKQTDAFAGRVDFDCLDFLAVQPFYSPGLLIYCDPPYAGTAGYPSGPFDHSAFWQQCRLWSMNQAVVYVSEFSAPVCQEISVVWEKERKSTFNKNGQSDAKHTEKLFRVSAY